MTHAEAVEEVKRWSREVDAKLAAGECPECGGQIRRIGVDRRQDGFKGRPGEWVNYRCLSCRYVIDVVEAVAL